MFTRGPITWKISPTGILFIWNMHVNPLYLKVKNGQRWLFKWDSHWSKCKVHKDTVAMENSADNLWQTKRSHRWGVCAECMQKGRSLCSHLQDFWWNRGSGWPWIWISRPSTGRRQSHLLFVQPTWKNKERKKKHAGGGIKLMYVCHERVAFASSLAY